MSDVTTVRAAALDELHRVLARATEIQAFLVQLDVFGGRTDLPAAERPEEQDRAALMHAAATRTVQQFRLSRASASLPEGVSYYVAEDRFRARPYRDGKRISLGSHKTVEAAAAAIAAWDAAHPPVQEPARIESAPGNAGPEEISLSHEEPTILDGSGEVRGASALASSPPDASPEFPSTAQVAGVPGAIPEQGLADCAVPDSACHSTAQARQCVTAAGMGDAAAPADPVPAPDTIPPVDPASQLPAAPRDGKDEAPASSSSLDLPPPPRGEAVLSTEEQALEQTLELFGSTVLSMNGIADRLGVSPVKVRGWIRSARERYDARVIAGDTARESELATIKAAIRSVSLPKVSLPEIKDEDRPARLARAQIEVALERPGSTLAIDRSKPQPELVEVPVIGPVHSEPPKRRVIDVPETRPTFMRPLQEERNLPVTGAARSKPLSPVAPVTAPPKAANGTIRPVPVGPIAIDEKANVVVGPGGEWATHRPCIAVLKRLAKLQPGTFLDASFLTRDGMSKSRILESIPTWKRELAAIGIELGVVGRECFYLARLEGAVA